jgi:hypothetical protein
LLVYVNVGYRTSALDDHSVRFRTIADLLVLAGRRSI